jgi:SAM-dependent methyltransferase
MDFYTLISEHYNEIFPLSQDSVAFVKKRTFSGSSLLDAGCGTGEMVRALRTQGVNARGFDLDEGMILKAAALQEDFPESAGVFKTGNLTDLTSLYDQERFDCICCLGNTLIHIPFNLQFQFLRDSILMLKPGGRLILQILNYKNILDDGMEFPILDSENFRFIRKYEPGPAEGILYFNTRLEDKRTGEIHSNTIIHYPLKPETLMASLSMSGYAEWNIFGSFSEAPAVSGMLPLIVDAIAE